MSWKAGLGLVWAPHEPQSPQRAGQSWFPVLLWQVLWWRQGKGAGLAAPNLSLALSMAPWRVEPTLG